MTSLANGDAAAPTPTNTADNTATTDLNASKRKRDDEASTLDETAPRVKRIQKDILEVLTGYAQAKPYTMGLH